MKTTWSDKYKVYKKTYLEKQESLIKKGSIMNERMLSEREFVARYNETKAVLQEDIDAGRRKAIGNMYQTMVSDQAYAVDYRTYNAIRRHNRELGYESNFTRSSTYSEIKESLSDEFWESINEEYDRIKAMYGATVASSLISQFYFGSE